MMSKEKQIEEIRKDIFAAFGGYAKWEEDWQSLAEAVYNAGYRKQSENMVEVVRCKDCVHASFLYSCGKYMCKKGCGATKTDNDFCSYGAKTKGGEDNA